jgi:membrane carboxypeptidase/penicillin-binding protein
MPAVLRTILWTAGGLIAALGLAVLLWPLPRGIAPVLVTDPAAVSAETRLVVLAGDHVTARTARLLLREDGRRGASRHLLHAALVVRLALFTTRDERAAFLAMNSFYGFGHDGLAATAEACFGKSSTELALAEVAELVVRERAPARFARSDEAAALLAGRDRLLRDLGARGVITGAAMEAAIAVPLGACR